MRETRTDANIDKSTNGYVMTRRNNSIEKKKRHPPDSHLVLAWGDKKEKEKVEVEKNIQKMRKQPKQCLL